MLVFVEEGDESLVYFAVPRGCDEQVITRRALVDKGVLDPEFGLDRVYGLNGGCGGQG